ncbi:MAG: hypothetical protein Phog2KO_14030 [Phototrophicaceae bacterium]
MTDNSDLVDQLEKDYRKADLSDADKAMLDYASKLTRTPWDMQEDDLAPLRTQSFDDRAILDIAQVTAYYAYVNRIADGLGVSLEDYWAEGKDDYE